MKPILEIKNISKKYRIGHERQSYYNLRDSLFSLFKKSSDFKEDFWALTDVSFDIFAGESIGIIGKNGAGKSTMLKILSKITPPTKGKIISRGRIASLLEVGTGFHGELTGRENIFLNGSILGMKRKEIQNRFDEIVDFSGTEKFLDTSLKHYSSGMQLRLAFAVAAHLEPEILIIDEVLAVGDAEFQKKCMGKMNEVSKSGRTVLFVSHNMTAVSNLCSKTIILHGGKLIKAGETNDTIQHYLSLSKNITYSAKKDQILESISLISIRNDDNNSGKIIQLEIILNSEEDNLGIDMIIKQNEFPVLFCSSAYYSNVHANKGSNKFICEIGPINLAIGTYTIDLKICRPMVSWVESHENVIDLEINSYTGIINYQFELNSNRLLGFVIPRQKWKIIKSN